MTSVQTSIRLNRPSHFMPLSSLQGLIFAYNPTAGATQFVNATWASTGNLFATAGSPYLSSVNGAGAGILRDVGKQVLSSGRVFRKVQLVVRNGPFVPSTGTSTFGVAGKSAGTNPNEDYLTGYIELGYEGTGIATPVVQYGTL